MRFQNYEQIDLRLGLLDMTLVFFAQTLNIRGQRFPFSLIKSEFCNKQRTVENNIKGSFMILFFFID